MLDLAGLIVNALLMWQLVELLRLLVLAGLKLASAVVLGMRPPQQGRLWRLKLKAELDRRRLAHASG